MKLYYKIFAALLIMAGISCKKQLYKDPIGLLTPDQVNTDPKLGTVQSAVTSSYQMLAGTLNLLGEWAWDQGTVLRGDFILQDIASGDMQKKWNPDGDQAWMDQFGDFSFTAANGGFNGLWSYNYEGISRSNVAISYLTNTDIVTQIGMDETTRKNLLGQVYFLRAFYYFDLVNLFGDVPLLLKPLENFADAYGVAQRETKENVYIQINKDLDEAKSLLPDGKYVNPTERWRASKGAVIALQAKVALYNQQWNDVISRVNELQTLGYYSLNDNYFDNFLVGKEFADNEVIFAYDHRSAQNPRNGNGITALAGWGFIAPTANFLSEFETNDPRLKYTVDVADQNVYKYFGELNNSNKGNDDAASNKVYIRWADVMLWKAEALNETGAYAQAVGIINEVRERARTTVTFDGGMAPAGTLPDRNVASTDKAQIKSWLIHERRVELGFESQRFNDLKRWGLAKDFLTGLGRNFKDINYVYPIPQGEIDKSGGSIVQNPGY